MIRRFLGALQFLTLMPIRRETVPPGEAAVFFPVVGALLGAIAGLVFYAVHPSWGRSLASIVAIAALIAATGGLHEDGLADVADAFRAGRSRERILTILKDSRIGVYGALVLIVSFAVRWQSLLAMQVDVVLGLTASVSVSRSVLVLLAFSTPPAGEGSGALFVSFLSAKAVWAVLAQAVFFAALCGWRGVVMLLASGLIVIMTRFYFLRRLGGVNGDCLGAACQIAEAVNLMVLAWQHFS